MNEANASGDEVDADLPGDTMAHVHLKSRIGTLLREQPYAVLCTQSEQQPYGSLVAFAATDDLRWIVFATPVTTRKFRLLSECDHVALLVDSRSTSAGEMMEIEAVTATGRATQVERGEGFERWSKLLTHRHPHLAAFVSAASCALFRVEIVRYFHVVRFQEVRQWIPTDGG